MTDELHKLHIIEDDLAVDPEEWLQPEIEHLEQVTLPRHIEFDRFLDEHAA